MAKKTAKKAKKTAVKKEVVKKLAKKVVKKSPAKAKVYVKVSSKILGDAPQECEFYVIDGTRLKNLYELIDALEKMNNDVFKEHVNDMKNDFSSWINDVFEAPDVAKEFKKAKDQIEAQKVLIKQLLDTAKKSARK